MLFKYSIISIFCFFLLGIKSSFAQCEKLKNKKIYQILGAAEYDNARNTEIKTYDLFYKEEYQINLFKGVVYKLVFDVSKMPEGVIIKLHDIGNKKDAGKYELVFNSENETKSAKNTYEITMEFPLKKMQVSYEVPENTKPGCVSFILGYYFKNSIK
ncbi:MAG: hypothetical protein P8Q14_02580 [Vicingaceae bacterium]|nr:hypothetical protein [Vicingaceae bacterium]